MGLCVFSMLFSGSPLINTLEVHSTGVIIRLTRKPQTVCMCQRLWWLSIKNNDFPVMRILLVLGQTAAKSKISSRFPTEIHQHALVLPNTFTLYPQSTCWHLSRVMSMRHNSQCKRESNSPAVICSSSLEFVRDLFIWRRISYMSDTLPLTLQNKCFRIFF